MDVAQGNKPLKWRNAVARTRCTVCRADPGTSCVDAQGRVREKPHAERRWDDERRHCIHCGKAR